MTKSVREEQAVNVLDRLPDQGMIELDAFPAFRARILGLPNIGAYGFKSLSHYGQWNPFSPIGQT